MFGLTSAAWIDRQRRVEIAVRGDRAMGSTCMVRVRRVLQAIATLHDARGGKERAPTTFKRGKGPLRACCPVFLFYFQQILQAKYSCPIK